MRVFIFILIFMAGGAWLCFSNPKRDCCAAKPKTAARCTGSANCKACTNCTRCQYCNAGGSCGVCRSGATKEKPARQEYSEPEDKSAPALEPVTAYRVIATTLNLRKQASNEAETICLLHHGDQLKWIRQYNDNWIEVEAVCGDGKSYKGFVFAKCVVRK